MTYHCASLPHIKLVTLVLGICPQKTSQSKNFLVGLADHLERVDHLQVWNFLI